MTAAPTHPSPTFAQLFDAITGNVSTVVHGKREAIELAVICMLAEGHLLIEDVPGVGKTSLAKALAASIDCSWKRVQFTPDLLPADLIGVSVYQRATESFVFQPGPLFANIVLADEINRASPKTQSALLEAMEERQVSADGKSHRLPIPFMVAATQNPVEQEGTYRLPESQLDRFLMRLSLGYPGRNAEIAILDSNGAADSLQQLEPVVSADEVITMCDAVRAVHIAPVLKSYLVDIAEASRAHSGLLLGLSPRATLQLARGTRAHAAARGRDYCTPDDVKAVATAVLSHRVVLRPDAASRADSRVSGRSRSFSRQLPFPRGVDVLTRAGWAALAAAVGSILTGRLFGLLELYVLGAGVAIVVLVSWFVVNRRLPAFDVRRAARPSAVTVGEPARVDLFVANRGHRRAPRLRLWEPVGERGGAPMQLAPLDVGDSVTAAYRVPTAQRGVLRTGPLQAEHGDPLGLCRRTTILAGTGEILVMPERVPLMFPGLASNGKLGEHLRVKAMGRTGSEFHSQREYMPGDDLRRINWKSSARTGTLIVREPALESVHRCTVVLDTHRDGYDHDAFERAVTAAASIVSGAASAGATTRLVAPGLDVRGTEVAHESMRWLAIVEPGDEIVDPFAMGRAYGDGLGLLVVVTSAPGSSAHINARGGAGPDESLVVVATAASGAGGRFVVDASTIERLERNWNQLVTGHSSVMG